MGDLAQAQAACQDQLRATQDALQVSQADLVQRGALEATAVLPEGRISPGCLGLWDPATEAALGDNLARARRLAPHMAVCIQLAHAGRKASSAVPWDGAQLLAPAQGIF